jgi:aminopeptidase N
MKTVQHQRRYLSDYRSPDFTINKTWLEFDLEVHQTLVKSRLHISRQGSNKSAPLELDGIELKLLSLSIDGVPLQADQYQLGAEQLTIFNVPDEFVLACEVEIDPSANTRLEGLYLSSGYFYTQCEAEGFRYITYYIDRPDVMSVFTTRIIGDRAKLPVLLSNGNRVNTGEAADRHWVEWVDPFPKPSYLFALVAGDLANVDGEFVTRSGKTVALQFFTEHHNRDKCGHALASLQKAMRWDEEMFGLEYDLDLYMVVAVDDFNMGAMENKGLNVFNTRYVLANPQTATDGDYHAIEAVIGHEYFHNWTGNRVTCRDWFQLSLKEGLTVFRDQEFSADMTSRAIQRISDVRVLRNHQFPEDAGPMAHPVQPASYQEINNFYTATVYNKGAEVVRMMHTLLGREGFRKGMDLYFQRHDGQAVTTDDFRLAMQDASGIDLDQFQRWYGQSGTPGVEITRRYDAEQNSLELNIRQDAGQTRGKPNRAFHIPMRLSLFDQAGQAIELDSGGSRELVVDIREAEQTMRFNGISDLPVVSAFREFSAPVILRTDHSDEELSLLMSCDTDPFNSWEASQQFATGIMLKMLDSRPDRWPGQMQGLVDNFGVILNDAAMDIQLMAEMLVLPSEKYLGEMLEMVDVHKIRNVRESVRRALAHNHEQLLAGHYHSSHSQSGYRSEPDDIANRRLKNTCLNYLLTLDKTEYFDLCLRQFETADNMTDQTGCLVPIVHYQNRHRDQIVAQFYQQWQDTALVVDKWFSAQAASYADGALDHIISLFGHEAYTLHNPNRARSLLGALIANSSAFHQSDGAGYEFVADKIMQLDAINPQVSARMANAFLHWRKLIPTQRKMMKQQVERMMSSKNISNDLSELITTSLQGRTE